MLRHDHPLWSVIKLAIMLLALTIILWLNASNFDETELRTILFMFFAAAGTEGFFQRVGKHG